MKSYAHIQDNSHSCLGGFHKPTTKDVLKISNFLNIGLVFQ